MIRFVITKPSVWMYKTEDMCGEVSDELLFGTTLEVLSENDTCVYCRTDYDYKGYVSKWEICECETQDCYDSKKKTVFSRCDVLTEPKFNKVPFMSLPKGARVYVSRQYDERFSEILIGERKLYIPNFALEKKEFSGTGEEIAENARSYIGTPYRWGGKTENGIDCSGLVFMSCRLSGRKVYRDSVADKRYVEEIPDNIICPGDIAYFDGHVAVMTGENTYVHASGSKGRVLEESFGDIGFCKSDVKCFARVKEA